MIYGFDIETNQHAGLIHCVSYAPIDAPDQVALAVGKDEILRAFDRIAAADAVVAHNGVEFDSAVVRRLLGIKLPPMRDTLIVSKYLYPDIYNHPNKGVFKPNSIAAWGQHFGMPKSSWNGPWDSYCDEMGIRCVQDVRILCRLYQYITEELYSRAQRWDGFQLKLEHAVAARIREQVENGVAFDFNAADALERELELKRAEISDRLVAVFPPLPLQLKTKVKMIPFNPRSRDQFAARIIAKYGWKPTKFTPTGKPKMDVDVVQRMPYPEARIMEELDVVNDRLEKVASWIAAAKLDGRVHGKVNTIGAVTHRMSHSDPHLGQVPKVKKPYGKQCRSCFIASPGMIMVGCDLAGIEMRLLAELMAPYDGGRYINIAVSGDPHETNRQAMEIKSRDDAKNTYYALAYGAGNGKLAKTAHVDDGQKIRDRLAKNLPALDIVIKMCQSEARRLGYLVLLDGRRAPAREIHKSLNTKIQGNAAIVHKLWFVLCCQSLEGRARWLLNVHDELEFETRPEYADEVGRIMVAQAKRAGEILKLKVPIGAEYKVGKNWAETH